MLQTEQLRAFLLEYLKAVVDRRDQLQYTSCLSGVEYIAKERCPEQFAHGAGFRDEDGARLKHVIWDLILERVLVPSTNHPRSSNDGWPFLSITDHGRKVIAEQKPVPYDPDGYLARLLMNYLGLKPVRRGTHEEHFTFANPQVSLGGYRESTGGLVGYRNNNFTLANLILDKRY